MMTKMTGGNFNWFLHTMLFIHTQQVIWKQERKKRTGKEEEEEEEMGIDIVGED